MKREDVEDLGSQEDKRQRNEISREQKQTGYELDREEERGEMGRRDRDEELQCHRICGRRLVDELQESIQPEDGEHDP